MAIAKKADVTKRRSLYRTATDFVIQIEDALEASDISQAQLAKNLGKTQGWVSQVLNNPGNLTIETMYDFASVLGMKLSIVAYQDDTPVTIFAGTFVKCWKLCGCPHTASEVKKLEIQRLGWIDSSYELKESSDFLEEGILNGESFEAIEFQTT